MADENTCGVLLKQIHDELKKMADNSLRANDLTMVQLQALLVLNQLPAKQRCRRKFRLCRQNHKNPLRILDCLRQHLPACFISLVQHIIYRLLKLLPQLPDLCRKLD